MRYEYLTHVVPLAPGPDGQTAAILNDLALAGWRLVSSFPMPLRPSLLQPDQQALGLFVVLERPAAGVQLQ